MSGTLDSGCHIKYLVGPSDRDETEVPDPAWTDVEQAIRQLNGIDKTLLIFGSGPIVPHLAVGGGQDSRYIVYATHDNQTFHTLVEPDAGPGKSRLVAGGQLGEYPLRNCVSLENALRAAKVFYRTCELDQSQKWDTR